VPKPTGFSRSAIGNCSSATTAVSVVRRHRAITALGETAESTEKPKRRFAQLSGTGNFQPRTICSGSVISAELDVRFENSFCCPYEFIAVFFLDTSMSSGADCQCQLRNTSLLNVPARNTESPPLWSELSIRRGSVKAGA
jgi:hypothetical protein